MASFGEYPKTLKRSLSIEIPDTNEDNNSNTFSFSPIHDVENPHKKLNTVFKIPSLNLSSLQKLESSPNDLIRIYYNEFKQKTKGIYVENPHDNSQKISLGDLFENICESLLHGDKYLFSQKTKDKNEYKLLKSQRVRKFNGVYNVNDNNTYTIESSTIYISKNDTIINKNVCLYREDYKTYAKAFVSIIHEVCCQYYAYSLISNDEYFSNFIKIPKLYKISIQHNEKDIDCISIFMKNLPFYNLHKSDINENFFNKWNSRINSVFSYLLANNLKHNDTAYRNLYFTGLNINSLQLAIIDFGEATFPDTETSNLYGREEQSTGYVKYGDFHDFKDWIDGRGNMFLEHWGGKLRRNKQTKKNKRNKRNKTNKQYKINR